MGMAEKTLRETPMRTPLLLLSLCLCLLAVSAAPAAAALPTPADLARLLTEAGVEGVVVLRAPDGTEIASDPALAGTGSVPASTYKILHALIALETGAVDSPDEIIPWDGVAREVPAWNQDQTLRTAIARSAVWAFQVLARRIGPARMQEWVDRAGYGNGDLGGPADAFWLRGDLRITPHEQITFLDRLLRDDLPFSRRDQATVRDCLVLERGEGWILCGKTGWSGDTGWLVGWVERLEGNWLFATRIAIRDTPDLAARAAVSRAALRLAGALP